MPAAERDLEELYVTILFLIRRGRNDWAVLADAALVFLPGQLQQRLCSELRDSRQSGHAQEVLAMFAEIWVPQPARPLTPGPTLPEREPKLKDDQLRWLRFHAEKPDASVRDAAKVLGIPRATIQDWRTKNKRIEQWLDTESSKRLKVIEEEAHKRIVPGMTEYLAGPPGVGCWPEFQEVAVYFAQHLRATDEAAECATGVPASLIRRWRRLPVFEAAMAQRPVAAS